MKTVFDADTGELLGAHMIGAEVTELIQGYAIAKTGELTDAELAHTIFPHPTLSEMMHEAVLDADKRGAAHLEPFIAACESPSAAACRRGSHEHERRQDLDGACVHGWPGTVAGHDGEGERPASTLTCRSPAKSRVSAV